LPSDVIAAAAAANPAMFDVVGPFATMQALPSSLAAVEPLARQILTSGWRPPIPDGPSKDELVQLVTAVSPHRRVLVGQ